MIKENEIRVGNYYNRTETLRKDIIGIVKFDSSDWYAIGECMDYLESYDPIPLTEEILLKCGFEYLDDLGIFFKGLFEIQKLRLGIDLRERFEVMLYDFNPSLDYLHQLQNLYFALTSEELNVNL